MLPFLQDLKIALAATLHNDLRCRFQREIQQVMITYA